MKNTFYVLFAFLFSTALLVSCSDDDDNPSGPVKQTGTFTVTVQNAFTEYNYFSTGVFNTPVGGSSPAPAFPGETYSFEFSAAPGHKLSFATMLVQSNDLFYAPDENGIDLFDNAGNQITGDITSQIMLWDSGTEINEEPGLGGSQAPRQSGPNTGDADPNSNVRLADDEFNNLPAVSEVIKVTLSSLSATRFKVDIENVSTSSTIPTSDGNSVAAPIAPGVFVIHTGSAPLFMSGTADSGNGLEDLAEDGSPVNLSVYLEANSGLVSPFAPGIYVVHTNDDPVFTEGQADRGEGLEALAEDGDPSTLSQMLQGRTGIDIAGVFNTPSGGSGPGVIFPGQSYSFTFDAEEGQVLSFATMLVQSNDLFVGTGGMGIDLFDGGGNAISGDITSMLYLWDAGTEVNEEPGIGLNQAPRQSGPDTGASENGVVVKIQDANDGFNYPAVSGMVSVTIEVQ